MEQNRLYVSLYSSVRSAGECESVDRNINSLGNNVISTGIYTNLVSLPGNEDWLGRGRRTV